MNVNKAVAIKEWTEQPKKAERSQSVHVITYLLVVLYHWNTIHDAQ